MDRPRARHLGLLTSAVGEQLVVNDQERQQLHTLNMTSALIWRHCDGQHSIDELAELLARELGIPPDLDLVVLALEELRSAHLLVEDPTLQPPPPSERVARRDVLRTAAVLATGMLLPTVTTFGTPAAARTASAGLADPTTSPPTTSGPPTTIGPPTTAPPTTIGPPTTQPPTTQPPTTQPPTTQPPTTQPPTTQPPTTQPPTTQPPTTQPPTTQPPPATISARLSGINKLDGNDWLSVKAPARAAGATVELFVVKSNGHRVLIQTGKLNAWGNKTWSIRDTQKRQHTTYIAHVGATAKTAADFTNTVRIR